MSVRFERGTYDLPRLSAIEVVRVSDIAGFTLTPVADAFVRGGIYSGVNYGKSPDLDVKMRFPDENPFRKTYLKFSLQGLTNVGTATLRIYGFNYEDDFPLSVYAYTINDDGWTENGITFNNAPARPSTAITIRKIYHTQKYYEIDVTRYVQDQLNGDKTVSFLLENSDNRNRRVVFNSKESGSNPPQLVIQSASAARIGQEILTGSPEENGKLEMSVIYPNPVQKKFTIQLASQHDPAISAKLIANNGQPYPIQLPKGAMPGAKAEVDISGLSVRKGIYLIKIQSATFSEIHKVLVVE